VLIYVAYLLKDNTESELRFHPQAAVIVVSHDLLLRAGNTADAFEFNDIVLHSGILV